jgi:hypothetical protein
MRITDATTIGRRDAGGKPRVELVQSAGKAKAG